MGEILLLLLLLSLLIMAAIEKRKRTEQRLNELKMDAIHKAFYQDIELTDQEKDDAILEAKVKKYFHVKSRDYWADLEKLNHLEVGNVSRAGN